MTFGITPEMPREQAIKDTYFTCRCEPQESRRLSNNAIPGPPLAETG